jgi:hypothetical protein
MKTISVPLGMKKPIAAVTAWLLVAIFGGFWMTADEAAAQGAPGFRKTESAESSRTNRIPPEAEAILQRARQLELFSIEPVVVKDQFERNFHNWRILGATVVTNNDVRELLVTTFKKAIEENTGYGKPCFCPRHAIRVTHHGETADFLICFECLQVRVWLDGKRGKGFRITDSPQRIFNLILTEAGVPLADNFPKKLQRNFRNPL